MSQDPEVDDATARAGFSRPDLTSFCRLDELGLLVAGQRLEAVRAVPGCGGVTATTDLTAVREGTSPTAGHGRGLLQAGVQDLAA